MFSYIFVFYHSLQHVGIIAPLSLRWKLESNPPITSGLITEPRLLLLTDHCSVPGRVVSLACVCVCLSKYSDNNFW